MGCKQFPNAGNIFLVQGSWQLLPGCMFHQLAARHGFSAGMYDNNRAIEFDYVQSSAFSDKHHSAMIIVAKARVKDHHTPGLKGHLGHRTKTVPHC